MTRLLKWLSGKSQRLQRENTYVGKSFLLCTGVLVSGGMAAAQEYEFTASTPVNTVQVGQPVDLAATFSGDFAVPGATVLFLDSGSPPIPGNIPVENIPVCAGETPTTVIGQTLVGHCVTRFWGAGRHRIDSLDGGHPGQVHGIGGNSIDLTVTDPIPFDANQFALTGAWYNPASSAQGLVFGVYPDRHVANRGFLFGSWMTFDSEGVPLWYTLQGDLSSDNGNSYDLVVYVSSGGSLDDSTWTRVYAVGTAVLTFYDCTHAGMTYAFSYGRGNAYPYEGRSGTVPYIRLTAPSGCSVAVPASSTVEDNGVLHSGVWAGSPPSSEPVPAQAQQGLVVDIVPAQRTFFAGWYTHALGQDGVQAYIGSSRWFTLQTDYTPGDLALQNVPIYATTGGVFNDVSDTRTQQVGSADISFTSCTTMTFAYAFTGGEFAGHSGTIEESAIEPVEGCQ